MMLKANGEFIRLPDEPEIVRQTKTADILDSEGDFSYEFMIPDTAETRGILGILSFDTFDIDSELVSENGYTLYNGVTSIERFVTGFIACSFKSGNTNWFTLLSNKLVLDIPIPFLERFKIPIIATSPSADLVASWSNTEGIVFPLTDRGRLRLESTDRLTTADFQPWSYIRDVFIAVFQSNGLKIQGELLEDGLFNTLIASSLSSQFGLATEESSFPFYNGYYTYVGKNLQSLNTTPQKVTFTLDTFPYVIGSFTPWDSSLSRYTNTNIKLQVQASVNFIFSSSVTYSIEVRRNGVVISTKTGTGLSAVDDLSIITMEVNDYFEIWAYVSSGTVNINSGANLRVIPYRLSDYYPQYFFGSMTQSDLVKSIFTMFNVIPTYDKGTKTVTANLFENLAHKEPTDLSEYVSSYEIDAVQVLSELAKDIILMHQSSETDVSKSISNSLGRPFGSAVIRPDRVLTDTKEVETQFTATVDYFNEKLQASLMDLGTILFDISDTQVDISSVADNGSGIARFTTTESHGFNQLDFVYISDTSTGDYLGIGRVSNVPTDTTFDIQHLDFVSTATGKASLATRSYNLDNVYIASYFPSMPVSNFSFKSTVNYEGTDYSEIAWAFFLKQNFGLPIDDLRKSPAFGKDDSNTSITLSDSYYNLYTRSINKPITINAQMLIPEKVYMNMDLSAPFTINTPEFSWRFFLMRSSGYISSHIESLFELLKLS